MLKNNFKMAWRTIVRNKVYSIINITGLTIGLCACMLVGTVVLDDTSYDQFWSRKNDLYRIITTDTVTGFEGKIATALANLGNELKRNFPEVEAAGTVLTMERWMRKDNTGETTIPLDAIYADTNVWKMLDIQILEGSPQQYVVGQSNLIISESFRKQHFPKENPVGKILYNVSSYSDEAKPFLITGVMADLPQNTYLRAEAIQLDKPTSQELSKEGWGYYDEQMLLMKPNTDMTSFASKANRWYHEFLTAASEDTKRRIPVYEFQPITDIYLQSDFATQRIKGSMSNIYIFSFVSLLLLAIACINFINLSTARAVRRLRETGVRKVLGAARSQLIMQFLIESLLFFALSMVLACMLYALSIGPLEHFIGHSLAFNLLNNAPLFLQSLIAILLISLLTGAYPAWALANFNTSNALKNRIENRVSSSGTWVRKSLIVVQFGITLLVLIGMITIWRQVQYMENKDLGLDTQRVLSIPSFATSTSGNTLKQEITQLPGVQRVSLTGWVPTLGVGNMTKSVPLPQRSDKHIEVNFIYADADLPALLGLRLQEGRLFDDREQNTGFNSSMMHAEDKETRRRYAQHAKLLITATTAKLFKVSTLGVYSSSLDATPIGIIEDFHSISLRDPIKPTVILADEDLKYANILVKVMAGHEQQVMKSINGLWNKFHPGKPLKMNWIDDLVKSQYKKETNQRQLFTFFSTLSLFLAMLGVFGLIVHATEQRVKEIGVRKVLGASVGSIIRLFSMNYIKLAGMALLIASPIAWWAMNKWLENFAYRIDIAWWSFLLSGLIVLIISLMTVGIQSLKAAQANPAKSLRNE